MNAVVFCKRFVCVACLVPASLVFAGDQPQTILLPKPRMEGGKPLLQALKERKSVRDFKTNPLAPQVLSDLLWAGFGVNRPEIDHRTAPSTMNMQEIDVYVATADGLFVYDAKPHQMRRVGSRDLRTRTTGQAELKRAPVALILVADYARMAKAKPEQRETYAYIDAGFISQNIYLFCASEGLATVVHDLDRASLAPAMKLRPDQKIIIAQAVGYPK
jgi:nitroreductase